MIKKFILLSTGLLAAHCALAGSAYVGGNLGISSIQVNKNLTYPLYTASVTTHKFGSNYNAFHSQVFIGKEFNFSRWQFAIQGDFDGFTNSAKDSLSNYFLGTPASTIERLNYGFGLFALPEMQINDQVKVFAGPGIVTGHFIDSSSYTGGISGATGHYSNWLTGWAIKVGMISKFKTNWDLLFTYQYNQYESVTRTAIEPLSAQALQANYRPNINMFSIGTRYMFDGGMMNVINK